MIGSEGRRNQGVALGIGGWAGPVEFVPETTHTTNGLATFSRGLVSHLLKGVGCILELRLCTQPLLRWMNGMREIMF